MRPRLLDAFSGAGGCARGYQLAGFHVTGVDVTPQPRYAGDVFIQGDALEYVAAHGHEFDAIHASPPCQAFSIATLFHGRTEKHVDLVAPTRDVLEATGLPYVIENVPGAPIRHDLLLCGEMFGLGVHRHRYFELGGFFAMAPPHARHRLKGALTNCDVRPGHARLVAGHFADLPGASEAMGIDWMSAAEIAQAIPPAFTEFIGGYLLAAIPDSRTRDAA